MNRWERWERFHNGPKAAPPEHGIKIKRAGTTWWGQRWIGALEQVLRGDAGRLARGRTYARAGRTHDLMIESGKVSARVTGSRPTPYAVTLELAQLPESIWQAAIAGMAAQAKFSAALLAGEMPQDIDAVFHAAGASLFPKQRAELKASCSCPDIGDPCKHVAATHYVLGEALDRDPFLLFELRGRSKAQVLAALRAARGGEQPAETSRRVPGVRAEARAADYDKPSGALPALHFSFDEPATHGAVIGQLGTPAGWRAGESPADALAPLVRAAAEAARRIALAEPEPEPRADIDSAAAESARDAKIGQRKPTTTRRRKTRARRD